MTRMLVKMTIVATLLIGSSAVTWAASAPSPGTERPFSDPLVLREDIPTHLTLFSTALPDRARTLEPHQWAWEVGYLNSNSIVDQNNIAVTDRVIVDGEMSRMELRLKYGVVRRWEMEATVPYLVLSGGFSDAFIRSFESTFGFTTPRARRIRERNKFRYLFMVNGQNLINKSDKALQGLGDIPLQLKYQIRNEVSGWVPRVALRGILKAPTATNPLLGNGRVDGGIGVLAEQPWGDRILILANLDMMTAHLPLALKTIDIDPVVVSGMLGFEQFLTNRASWKVQWMAGSNPYPKFAKDMTALNSLPMGIAIGWAYRLMPQTTIKLMVSENINSAWPDFGWGGSVEGKF